MDPRFPDTALVDAATRYAQGLEAPAVFHHSVRVYLHASAHAEPAGLGAGVDYDPELLAVAAVLHDIGTTDAHNGTQRFEVDGADAAAWLVREAGRDDDEARAVWEAIALHTSPGIAERMGPLTRLVRIGVLIDFGGHPPAPALSREQAEAGLPRLDIEAVLADAVVQQALTEPGKAPGSSWPRDLVRQHELDPNTRGWNPAF